MSTHFDHGAISSAGFPLFHKLSAMMRSKLKEWREQRLERAQIEALEALSPEILDDIGVRIVREGRPSKSMAVCHPYVIAIGAMGASNPKERGER
jgi:hypothetical protein